MRDLDSGMDMGDCQTKLGRMDWAWVNCEEAIRRARRPEGAKSAAAVGRILEKRSTARRVTTSKVAGGRVSARAFCILMSVNVRARVSSRRKVAFLWLDSIKRRGQFWVRPHAWCGSGH